MGEPSLSGPGAFNLHPRNLTWPLKNDGWKMSFLLGLPIFKGYVKFPGCKTLLFFFEKFPRKRPFLRDPSFRCPPPVQRVKQEGRSNVETDTLRSVKDWSKVSCFGKPAYQCPKRLGTPHAYAEGSQNSGILWPWYALQNTSSSIFGRL